MLFSVPGFFLALLATAISNSIPVLATRPRAIADLFDVSFDSSVGGNCAHWGAARLNNIVSDAFDLAEAGLSAVDAAIDIDNPFHGEAFRLLAAWFINPALSMAQYSQIEGTYQAILDFLDGSNPTTDGGLSTVKPLLVCGDSWVIRQNMNDQAYDLDSTGQVAHMTADDGGPILLRNHEKYSYIVSSLTATSGRQIFPYWSTRLGYYLFDKSFGNGNDPTDFYCAGDGTSSPYGMTRSRRSDPTILILCDSSFRHNGRRLHAVDPDCANARLIIDNKAPTTATRIDNVDTDAGTFFHELIHVILGNQHSTPTNDEEYSPPRMLGKTDRATSRARMTTGEALVNPQTYTYTAIGFDYTINYGVWNEWFIEWWYSAFGHLPFEVTRSLGKDLGDSDLAWYRPRKENRVGRSRYC